MVFLFTNKASFNFLKLIRILNDPFVWWVIIHPDKYSKVQFNKILNLLNEESVSGESSGRELVYI